jgi:hypothetical protein
MKIQEENVLGVKDYALVKPQTKSALTVMKDLKIIDSKLLIVVPQEDKNIGLSLRNVEHAEVVKVAYLNPYELLNATKVVFMNDTRTGLQALIDGCISKHAATKKQDKADKKEQKKAAKKPGKKVSQKEAKISKAEPKKEMSVEKKGATKSATKKASPAKTAKPTAKKPVKKKEA